MTTRTFSITPEAKNICRDCSEPIGTKNTSKLCIRCYSRRRYKENKEEIKRYQEENKDHIKQRKAKWYKANRDDLRTKARENYHKTKELVQDRRLKQKYGISNNDYKQLQDSQENKCAICNRKQNNKRLAVDHNHKTGKVRGLLCEKCNRALGMFCDDIYLLEKAATYLKERV
jgi:hypothetical protein